MDDMKDKVKGFMKKVNNPFSSSSSGKFKGQGRVLGSSSSSGPTNQIPARPWLATADSRPNQQSSSSASTNSRSLPQKTSTSNSESQVTNRSGVRTDSDSNGKQPNGFDPYNSLMTSGKRNPNGYSLNVIECPVCGRGFGSEEEVSEHVESCLSSSVANNADLGSESVGNEEVASEVPGELESCVGAYVSGKPSESSKEVVLRLLRNIAKEPENPKFRRIRVGNPKIREAICDLPGGVDLLECVGFEIKDEDGEMWAVMEVPSKDQILSIRKAVLFLEPPKLEVSPSSSAPAKASERAVPEKVDRQVRVFFSVPENVAAKIQLPDSFYNLSAEELKREADMRRKKIAESQLLIPKSYKEQQAQASKKRYTKTLIRVQFPDGVVLQGIFSPREQTSALYEFVNSALKEPGLEFELLHPVVIKRRVIPRSPAVGERPVTLEDEELVPAALIKFRPIETDSIVFTGLCNELLVMSEPLESQEVASRGNAFSGSSLVRR